MSNQNGYLSEPTRIEKNDHYLNFSKNSRCLLLFAVLKQYNNLELLKIPTSLTKRKTQSPTVPPRMKIK